MSADNTDAALNPEVLKTRARSRPLTKQESLQRAQAVCASRPSAQQLDCSGEIFIGIFFDGTGNNEQDDYVSLAEAKRKQSNVVRLYHTYRTAQSGATRFFRHYVPGVGTPFPEIGDSGGSIGTATSWNGEPRLIWGLTRVLVSVGRFFSDKDFISTEAASSMANGLPFMPGKTRVQIFSDHVAGLQRLIAAHPANKPKLTQINISVFGFSRGAAQTRAFVNWLYELCVKDADGYRLAGIPVRVEFVGIFDTVASVGVAGAFTSGLIGSEGRQSWAYDNMQIHPGVESCVHMAAANEVRATFPMDSVRIGSKYPPNVKEYVYPGSHSDVGGGYAPDEQGKTVALARIPGFDMYCAALSAGVPLESPVKLTPVIWNALAPTEHALKVFADYMDAAKIRRGPVEEMMRQHMLHYFNYRFQARENAGMPYNKRPFFARNPVDTVWLKMTQEHLIDIIAAVVEHLEAVIEDNDHYDHFVPHPFVLRAGHPVRIAVGLGQRMAAHYRSTDNAATAGRAPEKLKEWKSWLDKKNSPHLVDKSAPERTVLNLLEALSHSKLPSAVVELFDEHVHDSVAGLAKQGLNEFLLNGIGIAKFRRIYFGDAADDIIHEAASSHNDRQWKSARARRAQQKQWDLEYAEHRRMRP